MNWFLTKIVYRIICGEGTHTAQFDEQLRLIMADSREEALAKASQIGKQEEEVFINKQKKQVQWKFINVSEIHRINSLNDGAELYSRIEEKEDAMQYIRYIEQKAAFLTKANTPPLLHFV